jgi:anti-sigma regulatory factor (Ser/Thr protein kinase)
VIAPHDQQKVVELARVRNALDFKPQYVSALLFAVRAIGMLGSAANSSAGHKPLLRQNGIVLAVFISVVCVYILLAAFLRYHATFSSFHRPMILVVDLGSAVAVNVWASRALASRSLDAPGNDVFWFALIGSVALCGASCGWFARISLLVGSAVVLVLMCFANGSNLESMNWNFAVSRVVFLGIGLMVTTVALSISEQFEEHRREQGMRAGEQQALGAMHRRALQDLKVIERLTHEDLSPHERLDQIHRHATALADYVRRWPTQEQNTDVRRTVLDAIAAADASGLVTATVDWDESEVSDETCSALGEAISAAVDNIVQHASTTAAFVSVRILHNVIDVQIRDFGCGIAQGKESSVISAHTGIGMSRIVTLIEGLGGSANIAPTEVGTLWVFHIGSAVPTPLGRHVRTSRLFDFGKTEVLPSSSSDADPRMLSVK